MAKKQKHNQTGMSMGAKLFAALVVLAFLALSVFQFLPKKDMKRGKQPHNPPFVKEGILGFWDQHSKDSIIQIDIEIADNPGETSMGLMFRRSMLDSQGMLFIFENEEEQSFWMKNTYIPLDIIFIASDQRIVHIAKNTKPHSEKQILSKFPAKYVVEVVGGFTARYGIRKGDLVNWRLEPS